MYISRGTQVTTPLSIRTWPLSGYINLLLCPVQSQAKGELETLSSQYKFYYKLSTLVRTAKYIHTVLYNVGDFNLLSTKLRSLLKYLLSSRLDLWKGLAS